MKFTLEESVSVKTIFLVVLISHNLPKNIFQKSFKETISQTKIFQDFFSSGKIKFSPIKNLKLRKGNCPISEGLKIEEELIISNLRIIF